MPRKKKVTVPEPRQLPSGNWFIQLRLGGRSISITEPDAATCHAKAVALKAGLIEQAAKPDRTTLRAAIDKYIDSRSAVLSPSTIRSYYAYQRNRFASIMDTPVCELNRAVLQNAVNIDAAHIAPKTLHNAYMFIAGVIQAETGMRYKIRLPKIMPHERPYLTPPQIKTFLAAVHGTTIEIPALLALQSLRCSEIVGLRWSDIDLAAGRARIHYTRVYNKDGKLVGKDITKNATSSRTIDLPETLVSLLAAAKPDIGDGFICTISPRNLYAGINRICTKNGLPKVGVHGLRHSFASLGYYLKVPDKAMQEMGGWADDQTMRKIYMHIARDEVERSKSAVVGFFDENANALANEES